MQATVDLIEIRATDTIGKPSRVEVKRDERGQLVSAVVRGVKVLGARSSNGLRGAKLTRYSDAALVEAKKVYDGLKSYTNHPANRDPNGERNVEHLLGFLENLEARSGDGVYADYTVVPTHPFAPTFVWLAEHRPAGVGLSHNARGAGSVQGDEFVIESIKSARSADVVTEPATTVSLFESKETPMGAPTAPATPAPASPATPAQPVAVVESKPADQPKPGATSVPDDIVALVEARVMAKFDEKLKAKDQELDKLRVQIAGRERKERVEALLLEARLPAHAVTEVFRGQLLEAKDDAGVKALLEDRKRIAWHTTPSSPPAAGGDAKPIDSPEDAAKFLREFKGGR